MADGPGERFQITAAEYKFRPLPGEFMERARDEGVIATFPDYEMGLDMPAPKRAPWLPAVSLFARDERGQSIELIAHGFQPFFYVRRNDAEHADPEMLRRELEDVLRIANGRDDGSEPTEDEVATLEAVALERRVAGDRDAQHASRTAAFKRRHFEGCRRVCAITPCEHLRSVMGYQTSEACAADPGFWRITLRKPSDVRRARDHLQAAGRETFESNVLFPTRYLIARGIKAAQWTELVADTMIIVDPPTPAGSDEPGASPSWRVHFWHAALRPTADPDGLHGRLRVMAFDCEMAGRRGHFPEPEVDAVIMISSICFDFGTDPRDPATPPRAVLLHTWKPLPDGRDWLARGCEDEEEKREDETVRTENEQADVLAKRDAEEMAAEAKKRAPERAINRALLPHLQIRSYDSEAQMLMAWRTAMRDEIDPDFLSGYNSIGFDMEYLIRRAQTLEIGDAFARLGRWSDEAARLQEETFSSKAYGTRTVQYAKIAGRVQMDLLEVIRRDHKLRSYKLDNVARMFLGVAKLDLHHTEITPAWNSDDPVRLQRLSIYCVKDSLLALRLALRLTKLVQLLEVARACGVLPTELLRRGASIRVFTQLLHLTQQANYVIPFIPVPEDAGETKYRGARVIEPECGYYDTLLPTVDYTGLYPSIMQALNLSFDTWLNPVHGMEKTLAPELWQRTKAGHCFVHASTRKGILCSMLDELLALRGRAKAEMKKYKDTNPEMYDIMDARQLAYKLLCNAVYGFTGAIKGKLPLVAISESVTAQGRTMIDKTKEMSEAPRWVEKTQSWTDGLPIGHELNPYGNHVIYGDSVTGKTALLIYDAYGGGLRVVTMEELGDETPGWWMKMGESDKECKSLENERVYSWTDAGWTPVERIIRHHTRKQLYRVCTHTGYVEVTEDHSLLRDDGSMCTPADVSIGTPLLHSFPDVGDWNQNIGISPAGLLGSMGVRDVVEARVMGFFFAEGTAGCYPMPLQSSGGWKFNWNMCSKDRALVETYAAFTREVFPNHRVVIADVLKSSHVLRIELRGCIKDVAIRYSNDFYDRRHGLKRIPDYILNASPEIRRAFWEGYYAGDGDNDSHGYVRCDIKGQIGAMGLYTLLRSLGERVSINIRSDKPEIYRLTVCRAANIQRRDPVKIKKIERLAFDGEPEPYVYDLTTTNHHFQAGVGSLIVHNTDSCMVNTKIPVGRDPEERERNIRQAIAIGIGLAKRVTAYYHSLGPSWKAVNLDYEKTGGPMILQAKKRYAMLIHFEDKGALKTKLLWRGMEVARRDTCRMTAITQAELLHRLLIGQSPAAAEAYIREQVKRMMTGDVDTSLLVISKELTREHYAAAQPHATLVEKMRRRQVEALDASRTRELEAAMDREMPPDGKRLKLASSRMQKSALARMWTAASIKKKEEEGAAAHVIPKEEEEEEPMDIEVKPEVAAPPPLEAGAGAQLTPYEELVLATTVPQIGDRVEYVFVRTPWNGDASRSERAEDPAYFRARAAEEGLRIDHEYYLEKQLLGPWSRIMDVVKRDYGFTRGLVHNLGACGTRAKDITGYLEPVIGEDGTAHVPHGVAGSKPIKREALKEKGRDRAVQATGMARGITSFMERQQKREEEAQKAAPDLLRSSGASGSSSEGSASSMSESSGVGIDHKVSGDHCGVLGDETYGDHQGHQEAQHEIIDDAQFFGVIPVGFGRHPALPKRPVKTKKQRSHQWPPSPSRNTDAQSGGNAMESSSSSSSSASANPTRLARAQRASADVDHGGSDEEDGRSIVIDDCDVPDDTDSDGDGGREFIEEFGV